jgi:enamine deaminase RidA (YjgF/YER057c/UK114 family)
MSVQRVPSASMFAPVIGFSAAVHAGDFVFVAGMTAVGPDGELTGGTDPYGQGQECLRKVEVSLAAVGADLSNVVSTRIYLVDAAHWREVGRAHGEAFGATRPAATMVVVGQLLDERMLVEIEAVAYLGSQASDAGS